MRVLLFTLEYPPFYGGVANYYGNLVKYWPAPQDIFVLHNNDGKLINNKLPFLKWLPAFFYLWRALRKHKIQHILVGHILPLGTIAYFISKITRIPFSIFLHGMDFTCAFKSSRKGWLAKKILKNSKNIICVNSYVARLVQKELKEVKLPIGSLTSRIVLVNPGIEKNLVAHNSRLIAQLKNKYNLHDKIILLTVGRLVKRKGVDKVLESLLVVLKEVPNLKYIIIGRGEEEKNLELRIASCELQKNVILITKATDEEKNAWLDFCDIFIMPSRQINGDFEGFGIVYLEANLYGKPVIAGDSGGVRDAVSDGINGLLVNPLDTKEIAAAIIKLAKDENLRKELGEQGRERALKEFNWEKQVRKILEIII